MRAQALAVVLSDGSLAAAVCPEGDDWEAAAEAWAADNLPQNAAEDLSSLDLLSMPLTELLPAKVAAEMGLMHIRYPLILSFMLPLNLVWLVSENRCCSKLV